MSDFKSKLPDINELGSMATKLYKDVKTSVFEIIKDYKQKHAEAEQKEAAKAKEECKAEAKEECKAEAKEECKAEAKEECKAEAKSENSEKKEKVKKGTTD